jgi:hypothetical protein
LAAVLQKRGNRWKLVAASNQEAVDPAADSSQALSRLAVALPQSREASFCAEGEPDFPPAVADALAKSGYQAVAWCHLSPSKKAPLQTVLLACWHESPGRSTAGLSSLHWGAGQLARALDAATHFHHMPLRRTTSAVGRVVRAWNEGRRRRVFAWIVLPALLAVGALLFPVPYKIKAACAVVPARTAAVVAETDGKVVEVSVTEGAEVRAGQMLARLEDNDFAAQMAVSEQQLARHRVEAARAQASGNEPERKIAELAVRKEQEIIKRLEYLRSRTVLRSPIDGVVLTRGVQERAGEGMEKGKLFCEVGSLGSYELQIDLRQRDIGPLLDALARNGQVPVDFILHAHARQALKGELSGALQISQLPELRTNETVFLARMPFPSDSLTDGVKSGSTGKASITLGRRPWGWLLTRPFLHYVKMNWSL